MGTFSNYNHVPGSIFDDGHTLLALFELRKRARFDFDDAVGTFWWMTHDDVGIMMMDASRRWIHHDDGCIVMIDAS